MGDLRRGYKIPIDILDDVCARFILDLPLSELQDHRRLIFSIEQAHWFYEDNYVSPPEEDELDEEVEHYDVKSVSINNFIWQVYHHCPQLREAAPNVDDIIQDWHQLKSVIPSYGAILINDDLTKVVLVQSMSQKANWGFPKGKRNEKEPEARAAAREVREETGFDIAPFMHPDAYLEHTFGSKLVRLYLVPHVPEGTYFSPRTRGEIKAVQWFEINHLPQGKRDPAPNFHLGMTSNSFFMVYPFILALRRWIAEYRELEAERLLAVEKHSFAQGTMNAISELLPLTGSPRVVAPALPPEQLTNKSSMLHASKLVEQYLLSRAGNRKQPTYEQKSQPQQNSRPSSQPSSQSRPSSRTQTSPQPSASSKAKGKKQRQNSRGRQQSPALQEKSSKTRKQKKKEKTGSEHLTGERGSSEVSEDSFPSLYSQTWKDFSLDFSTIMALFPVEQ